MVSGKKLGVRTMLAVTLALWFAFLPGVWAGPAGEQGTNEGAELLSSTEGGIRFRVSLPLTGISVEPHQVGDEDFVRIAVPGWSTTSQEGAPELPYYLASIGVPFGARLDVHVEPGETRTLELAGPVVPVPIPQADWDLQPLGREAGLLPKLRWELSPDSEIYASTDAYPGSLAAIVSDGVMRQQRVVGIAVYPLHLVPASGEMVVYESLEVSVTFDALPSGERGQTGLQLDSQPIEDLLQGQVLNFEAARQWRQTAEPVQAHQAGPWAPPEPGYRVSIEQQGLYKLTYGALRDAGLPVTSLDPATFQLYNMGSEVAVKVQGDGDSDFEDGEYVLFYGERLASKYAARNVYWLTYGQGVGKRMGSRSGAPSGGTVPLAYVDSKHLEENKTYVSRMPGDEDLERYLWAVVYPPDQASWAHTFSLTDPAGGSGTATLRLLLLGNSEGAHGVRIYVNGNMVGTESWSGIELRQPEYNFEQSILNAGSNVVDVRSTKSEDVVWVDWLELDYARIFVAEGDVLSFGYDDLGSWAYQIEGYTRDDLLVFDITDPNAVEQLTGASISPAGSGYALSVSDDVGAATTYLVVSAQQALSPKGIEQDTASNLQAVGNGADYIIVSHPAFSAAAGQLAAYRDSTYRVALVDVQDVYDEFGYGIADARAIRDFLAYAYGQWQRPAPSYVVLVGDGHYDPKDYQGYHQTSYIPPYLAPVDPKLGETAADNRYVSFTAGDDLPDMMLGRLAVNSTQDAQVVFEKIRDYEAFPIPGQWNQQVLFVADNADAGGNYAQMSDSLIACCLPAPYQPDKVYYKVTHPSVSEATTGILSAISSGKLVVNYIGDAGVTGWAQESLFLTKHIPSLTNGSRLPIMVPMAPFDGYFQMPMPSLASMAESMVRTPGKGAVASWSGTGTSLASGHQDLNRGFFDVALDTGVRTVGQATLAGKLRLNATGSNLDLLDTFTLIGDPALSIHSVWEGHSLYLPVAKRSAR